MENIKKVLGLGLVVLGFSFTSQSYDLTHSDDHTCYKVQSGSNDVLAYDCRDCKQKRVDKSLINKSNCKG